MTDINTIYYFDDFVLNPARRELKRDDTSVEIEPRAFDVLLYLVVNHDRAVDKDELQDAVWPGLIVTETALTRAVMKARKAVGDDASEQKVIKTLHGHGYRFVAKLSSQDGARQVENTVATSDAPSGPVQDKKAQLNLHAVALIGIAAIIILGLSLVFLRPAKNLADETRIAVLPVQDNTNNPDLAWTGFGLMSYTSKLIASDGSMPVVPVGSIISLAETFRWSGNLAEPVNEELLGKLKKVYGATHMLAMELESEGMALRMNYSLLTPDGELQRGTIVGDTGTDLAYGAVQAIYGNMFRRSRLGGDIALVSSDSFNNEAFARGMDLSLQGRCADAVRYFRLIIEQEPSLFEPRYELAACLRILGETQEAETLLLSLIDEQRPLGASRHLAKAMMTLGILYNRTGRLDPSEAIYNEALAMAQDLGEHELSARILQNLSIVSRSRSNLDESARLLDLALLSYQDAGLEVLPGQLYGARANLHMARGELVEAEAELTQALQAFREIGDRRNEAMMLNNTGYLRRRQGRLEEAEAYHLRSLEIREEIGDRVGVGRIYGMLSVVYSAQGLYSDAISAAESAREIARETNDRLFEATSLAQLAAAEYAMGNADSARLHYLEGRQIFVEIQDVLRMLQSDLKIANIDLSANRLDNVEQLVRQVLETSREQDILSSEVEALELLGDLARKQNDGPLAISEYNNALIALQDSTWDSKKNTIRTKLAITYMDEADLEAAAPLMGALAAGPPNVQSLKAQARFAYSRGDAEKAVSLMHEAKKLAGDNWADSSEATLKKYLGLKSP